MTAALFTPLQIGPLGIANRVIVAPMCQYSAQEGCANDWHRIHLGSMALSGAGLVTLEATGVSPEGRITPRCLGLYSDATEAALADVLRSVRAVSDVPLSLQLGHAGRKASSFTPWEGRGAVPRDQGGWLTLSPSGIALSEAGPETRAMSDADIAAAIAAHADAARRALRLGFEAVELHAGHGYLISSFLSPLSNTRTDHWGGTLENRMRFLLEVVRAVRAVWPADRMLSVKLNGTDWAEGGFAPDDAVVVAGALAAEGVDMITLSGGGILEVTRPPVAPGYQLEAARRIKAAGIDIVVGAVGMIHDPAFANQIIAQGEADVVSIARAFLNDPRWARHAAEALGAPTAWPAQYDRASPANWPPARR